MRSTHAALHRFVIHTSRKCVLCGALCFSRCIARIQGFTGFVFPLYVHSRRTLPKGPQEVFDEACLLYFALKASVEMGEVSWAALTTEQQRDMDSALSMWKSAADDGVVQVNCNKRVQLLINIYMFFPFSMLNTLLN